MIVNAALLMLYVWLMRSRDGAIALLCFGLSWVAFHYTQESHLTHLASAAIYCFCIFMKHIRVMALMTLVAVHQYIMAIDSILFPSTETILYGLYPYIALTLNILILANIQRVRDETASNHNNRNSIRGRTRVNH